MRRQWFAPMGWIHRPTHPIGFALVLLAGIFCVQVFRVVDSQSHSVSDTLYGGFPFIVPCLMLLEWVASKSSGRGN